jgi:hypothetical protein
MTEVKVWLGGEGKNELGDRDQRSGTRIGALEALLRKLAATGWRVEGATVWRKIRKYKAGGARKPGGARGSNHGDVQNVVGLVLHAYEAGCEIVAFCRDTDADTERAEAIDIGMAQARDLFSTIAIIGGPSKPALEGWMLALKGQRDSDEMSRDAVNLKLVSLDVTLKGTESYVDIIDSADLTKLPPGCDSLRSWIESGKVLTHSIHGSATVIESDRKA